MNGACIIHLMNNLRVAAKILDRKPSEVYGLNALCRQSADELERLNRGPTQTQPPTTGDRTEGKHGGSPS